jgi:hypothetical protein
MKLKCYIQGKLFESLALHSPADVKAALHELQCSFSPDSVFLSNQSGSRRIHIQKPNSNRSTKFIRSDGTVSYTLPLSIIHEPITIVLKDGVRVSGVNANDIGNYEL